MESVIKIFNGETEEVTTHGKLMQKSATEVVALLQTTAVFRDLLKELEPTRIGLHSVVDINQLEQERVLALGIERGYLALVDVLEHRVDEDSAHLILANIMNAINLEKCSD